MSSSPRKGTKGQKGYRVINFKGEGRRGRQKGYGTVDSRVVAHPSTNTAWRSLTSLFGWEAVLSAQYGRIHQPMPSLRLPSQAVSTSSPLCHMLAPHACRG